MEQYDMCNLWRNHTILNDIDSKRSSSCCFQVESLLTLHPRVTGFVHVLSCMSFFTMMNFVLISPICTPKLFNKKNIGLRAHSRAKDHRTSLAGALIENRYPVLEIRALIYLIMWFLCTALDAQCITEESPKLRFEKIGNWWQLSLLDMRVWNYFEAVLDFELKIQ